MGDGGWKAEGGEGKQKRSNPELDAASYAKRWQTAELSWHCDKVSRAGRGSLKFNQRKLKGRHRDARDSSPLSQHVFGPISCEAGVP